MGKDGRMAEPATEGIEKWRYVAGSYFQQLGKKVYEDVKYFGDASR